MRCKQRTCSETKGTKVAGDARSTGQHSRFEWNPFRHRFMGSRVCTVRLHGQAVTLVPGTLIRPKVPLSVSLLGRQPLEDGAETLSDRRLAVSRMRCAGAW